MKKILYLDMDGTLFDLHYQMIHVLGYSEDHYTDDILFVRDIYGIEYDKGLFRCLRELPIMYYFAKNEDRIREHYDEVKFLTYIGNHNKLQVVVDDKKFCLNNSGLQASDMLIVEGSKLNKQYFARPGAVLLDDCQQTVDAFNSVDGAKAFKVDPFNREITKESESEFLRQLGIK